MRAANNTKKRTGASGLLCISNVDVGPNGISYKTEADARKQMSKMLRYWPMYGPERSVYETHYVGQVFNQE